MSYIPKYIIKRMFKKDEAVKVVSYEGEEYVQLKMINVISPIEVPDGKIDLGGINLPNDVDKFLSIKVNGMAVPVNKDVLVNAVSLWFDGKKHTWTSIFEEGSAGGVVISVGGVLRMLIKKSVFPADVQPLMKQGTEVEVAVDVSIDSPMNITVKAVVQDGGEFNPSA